MKTLLSLFFILSLTTTSLCASGGDSGGGPKSLEVDIRAKDFKIQDFKIRKVRRNKEWVKIPMVKIKFMNWEKKRIHEGSDKQTKEKSLNKSTSYEWAYVPTQKYFGLTVKEVHVDVLNALKERRWFWPTRTRYRALARALFDLEVSEVDGKKVIRLVIKNEE